MGSDLRGSSGNSQTLFQACLYNFVYRDKLTVAKWEYETHET